MEEKIKNYYFKKSQDPDTCQSLYNSALNYIIGKGYEISNRQKEVLLNHISHMVKRNKNKEQIEIQDKSVFDEVSHVSLKKARELVIQLSNASENEVYLLAIHFDVVKFN